MRATLTCPHCGTRQSRELSASALVVTLECRACHREIVPAPGDGCVFCSHGDAGCCGTCTNPARCLPGHEVRHHVVLGISPFNSYYNERRLTHLADWSAGHFGATVAFIPDTPTAWTLEAGGYSPREAARKTARQVGYLRNKVTRAFAAGAVARARILPWSAIAGHPVYNEMRRYCGIAVARDGALRRACLAATDEVLENRRRTGHEPTMSDRRRAMDYLLAELPILLFAPRLFEVPTSTFVYHRGVGLFDALFDRQFAITPMPGQHFVIAQELGGLT